MTDVDCFSDDRAHGAKFSSSCAYKEHPIQHDTHKECYNTLCLSSERRCELVSFVQSQYLEEDLQLIAVAQR